MYNNNFLKNPKLYKVLFLISCSSSAYFSISHATSSINGFFATIMVAAFILMVECVKNILPAHAVHNKTLSATTKALFGAVALASLCYSIFASSGFLIKMNNELSTLQYEVAKKTRSESPEKALLIAEYEKAKRTVEELKKETKLQIDSMQANINKVPSNHSTNLIQLNNIMIEFEKTKNDEIANAKLTESVAYSELLNYDNNIDKNEYSTPYTHIYTSIADYLNKDYKRREPIKVEQVEFYVSLFCSILGELASVVFSYLYFSMRLIANSEIVEKKQEIEHKNNNVLNLKKKDIQNSITNKIGFKHEEEVNNDFKESLKEYLIKAEELRYGNELPDVIKLDDDSKSEYINNHLKELGIIVNRNNKDYLVKQAKEYRQILGL